MQLIGQKDNLDLICKLDKLPSFIIIQGEEHTGKNYFVLYLCKLFDLHYINVPITVKSIRDLVNLMVPNSNTVYHLDNFDDASIQAKNALLKVTEEPKPGNYIIITGGQQIPTLKSRARLIVMSPYDYADMEELYKKTYPSLDSKLLYKVGINTPAKIEFYKKCNQLNDILNATYSIFERITYLEPQDYVLLLKLFEPRYYKNTKDSNSEPPVDLFMLFLNMLSRLIENTCIENMRNSYYDILNIILKIKLQLRYEDTLNRRMLLLKMFSRIRDLHTGGLNN